MQIERKKKSKCKLSKAEIIHMYTEGESTSEIAMLANVSARYIRMVLSDSNVPRRAIGSWKREYDITENYFKRNYTVDTHPLKIVDTTELAIINKKAKKIRELIKRGVKFTPLQVDSRKIEEALLKDLENNQ